MKVAVLGSTRGLGRCFYQHLQELGVDCIGFARGPEADIQVDFSKEGALDHVMSLFRQERVTHIYYFAAGGPYGQFAKKALKDHKWAFQVTYWFPSQLLHQCLQESSHYHQFVLVGSAVAEDSADPFAVSYSAAKHALLGLHRGLVAEGVDLDVRLFSPGYLDTEMLPPNAWPRQQGLPIASPKDVAQKLWSFSQDPQFYQAHWRCAEHQ